MHTDVWNLHGQYEHHLCRPVHATLEYGNVLGNSARQKKEKKAIVELHCLPDCVHERTCSYLHILHEGKALCIRKTCSA